MAHLSTSALFNILLRSWKRQLHLPKTPLSIMSPSRMSVCLFRFAIVYVSFYFFFYCNNGLNNFACLCWFLLNIPPFVAFTMINVKYVFISTIKIIFISKISGYCCVFLLSPTRRNLSPRIPSYKMCPGVFGSYAPLWALVVLLNCAYRLTKWATFCACR